MHRFYGKTYAFSLFSMNSKGNRRPENNKSLGIKVSID
jgi:hypothetical protein